MNNAEVPKPNEPQEKSKDVSFSSAIHNGKWIRVERPGEANNPYYFSIEDDNSEIPAPNNVNAEWIGHDTEEAKSVFRFAADLLNRGEKPEEILRRTRAFIRQLPSKRQTK